MTQKKDKQEPRVAEAKHSQDARSTEASEQPRVKEHRKPRVSELGGVIEPLKCVWSGFPSHEHSCSSRIPASVVVRAWHREMHLNGVREGFFHFSWRSGVWLGYGLANGDVRGVYCPTHRAERTDRQSRESTIGQRGA